MYDIINHASLFHLYQHTCKLFDKKHTKHSIFSAIILQKSRNHIFMTATSIIFTSPANHTLKCK